MAGSDKELPSLNITGFVSKERHPASRCDTAEGVAPGWESRRPATQLEPKVRTRMHALKHEEKADAGFIKYKRLLIKTGICAGILLLIFMLKSIDTPITNDITDGIRTAVSHELEIDEIGRLKFVSNDAQETAEPAMSSAIAEGYVFPIEGMVELAFGESGSKGVVIRPIGEETVLAAGSGVVRGIDAQEGWMEIALADGAKLVYRGVVPQAEKGKSVYPGEAVATLAGETLYVELLTSAGEAVDPLSYLTD